MKHYISILFISLVSTICIACPPPTTHGVINVGATHDYRFGVSHHTFDNAGIVGAVGVELPHKVVSLKCVGGYSWGILHDYENKWYAGGEIGVNPLGIYYGYDSPINFEIICGLTYCNVSNLNFNAGIEITPSMRFMLAPFARVNFNMGNLLDTYKKDYNINFCAGIKLKIGEGW